MSATPAGAEDVARLARHLMRSQPTAALATVGPDGWPYASLVLVACRTDAAPLLLVSQLAVHTRNMQADPRVSLLFDGTVGLAERLTGARLSLLARAQPSTEAADRARFVARHPSAAGYAGFADFGMVRLEPERAHLVAGFGRIDWVAGTALRYAAPHDALAAAADDILAHMNADHADTVEGVATRLLGEAAGPWRMTGIDPEGFDLATADRTARAAFAAPVHDAEAARLALIDLARQARLAAPEGA